MYNVYIEYTNQPMNFDTFNTILNNEPIFAVMKNTKEDSIYHREESVYVHTMMVCNEFTSNYSQDNDDFFIGLFACLFHDTGKPQCRVAKESAQRGKYFSFAGHDAASAKIAAEIMSRYNFTTFEVIRICWFIEHHQSFWTVVGNTKKIAIVNDFKNPGIGIGFPCFKAFMMADNYGRICEQGQAESDTIMATFEQQYMV